MDRCQGDYAASVKKIMPHGSGDGFYHIVRCFADNPLICRTNRNNAIDSLDCIGIIILTVKQGDLGRNCHEQGEPASQARYVTAVWHAQYGGRGTSAMRSFRVMPSSIRTIWCR